MDDSMDSMLLENDNTSPDIISLNNTTKPGQMLASVSTATSLILTNFTYLDVLLIFINALLVLMIVIGCCFLLRFINVKAKNVPISATETSEIYLSNDVEIEQITIL